MPRHSTKIERSCKHCGKRFFTSRGRLFCSRKCYRERTDRNTLEDRLCLKTKKDSASDCILWMGTTHKGYGCIGNKGTAKVHRVAYEFAYGHFDTSLFVCHHCDNPSCVKPSHLFLGTHQNNMDDMKAKGRGHLGEKHGMAKLTEKQVHEIRRLRAEGRSMCGIGKQYGIARETVRGIINRTRWAHV